jgi:hypothetical protein
MAPLHEISLVHFGDIFIQTMLSWHSVLQHFAGQSSGQIPSGEPQLHADRGANITSRALALTRLQSFYGQISAIRRRQTLREQDGIGLAALTLSVDLLPRCSASR